MRDDEFAFGVECARRGIRVTDIGASDALDSALRRISLLEPGPQQDAAIEAARSLLAEERR